MAGSAEGGAGGSVDEYEIAISTDQGVALTDGIVAFAVCFGKIAQDTVVTIRSDACQTGKIARKTKPSRLVPIGSNRAGQRAGGRIGDPEETASAAQTIRGRRAGVART
jgi:hypothetical protein